MGRTTSLPACDTRLANGGIVMGGVNLARLRTIISKWWKISSLADPALLLFLSTAAVTNGVRNLPVFPLLLEFLIIITFSHCNICSYGGAMYSGISPAYSAPFYRISMYASPEPRPPMRIPLAGTNSRKQRHEPAHCPSTDNPSPPNTTDHSSLPGPRTPNPRVNIQPSSPSPLFQCSTFNPYLPSRRHDLLESFAELRSDPTPPSWENPHAAVAGCNRIIAHRLPDLRDRITGPMIMLLLGHISSDLGVKCPNQQDASLQWFPGFTCSGLTGEPRRRCPRLHSSQ